MEKRWMPSRWFPWPCSPFWQPMLRSSCQEDAPSLLFRRNLMLQGWIPNHLLYTVFFFKLLNKSNQVYQDGPFVSLNKTLPLKPQDALSQLQIWLHALMFLVPSLQYLGKWYDIQRLPHSFQKGECCTATYSLLSPGVVGVLNKELLWVNK